MIAFSALVVREGSWVGIRFFGAQGCKSCHVSLSRPEAVQLAEILSQFLQEVENESKGS